MDLATIVTGVLAVVFGGLWLSSAGSRAEQRRLGITFDSCSGTKMDDCLRFLARGIVGTGALAATPARPPRDRTA